MLVNVKVIKFLTPTETASLVDPTKSSRAVSVFALPATLSTAAVSAPLPAVLAISPSKVDVPSVLLTPFSELKSTDVTVLPDTTRIVSVSVRN